MATTTRLLIPSSPPPAPPSVSSSSFKKFSQPQQRVKHPEPSRLDGQVGGWFDAPGHQTVPQHDRGFIIHFFPPTSSSSSHLPVGRETVWYFRISLLPNEAKEAPGYILYQLRITRTVSMALLHVRVFIKKQKKQGHTMVQGPLHPCTARLCVVCVHRHRRRLRRRWFVRPSVRLFPWGAVF